MSSVVFIYAVSDQTGFFSVLAYALLVQLIAMALVGLAGVLAPRLRPELYRASASQKSIRWDLRSSRSPVSARS